MKTTKRTLFKALLLTVCINLTVSAQQTDSLKLLLDNYFNGFIDTTKLKTGILLDKGFVFGYEQFKNDSTYVDDEGVTRNVPYFSTFSEWRKTYESIRLASFYEIPKMLPSRQQKAFDAKSYDELKPIVPIGILNFKANYFKDKDIEDIQNKKKPNPKSFKSLKVFAIAPLFDKVYSGNVTFHLNPDHYYSNRKAKPKGVEINFSDGQDWKQYDWKDQKIPVNYHCEGDKAIKVRFYIGKDTLEADSKITIQTVEDVTPSETFSIQVPQTAAPISSNARIISPPSNSNIKGDVGIFLGCDGVLDKPIIILEGFDAPNTKNIPSLANAYSFLNENGRNSYDLVILNYGNGGDKIENNVLLFKELLRQINLKKKGNFENVVLGESMGGLIGRIGLRELENENYDHQTGLFVSFDSPHKGANVPIGLQHLSNDLLAYAPVALFDLLFDVNDLEELKAVRDAPAAKQMTVKWFTEVNGPHPDYVAMQAKLDALGHPQKCKKVAVTNGSNTGTRQAPTDNFNQGDEIFKVEAIYLLINVGMSVRTQKTSGSTAISSIAIISPILLLLPPYVSARWINSDNNSPYDIAAGGWQDQHKSFADAINFAASTNGRNQYCFVPAASSLDLRTDYTGYSSYDHYFYFNETATDANRHRANLIANNTTPFDDIFAQETNTEHVRRPWIFSRLFWDNDLNRETVNIQNRTISGTKTFSATNRINIGNNVGRAGSRQGAVAFTADAKVTMRAPVIDISGEFDSGGGEFEMSAETVDDCSNPYPRSPTPIIGGPTEICFSNIISNLAVFSPFANYTIANTGAYDDTFKEVTWTLTPNPVTGIGNHTSNSTDFLFPFFGRAGAYTLQCSIQTSDIAASTIAINVTPCSANRNSSAKLEKKGIQMSDIISNAISIDLSPNPAMEKIVIDFNIGSSQKATIILSDLLGTRQDKIFETINPNFQLFSETIDVTHLPSGFYTVTLITDNKSISKKLIIAK